MLAQGIFSTVCTLCMAAACWLDAAAAPASSMQPPPQRATPLTSQPHTCAAHHCVSKRARRRLHEDLQWALGGVPLFSGAHRCCLPPCLHHSCTGAAACPHALVTTAAQKSNARQAAPTRPGVNPLHSSFALHSLLPHVAPLQDTLNRIYKPEEQQRRRLGWLNPVSAIGALQSRESILGKRGRGFISRAAALISP